MQRLVTDAPVVAAAVLTLARSAAETLHKHYPGHLWAVGYDNHARMLDVRNLALSGNWGFRIRVADVFSATDLDTQVMRAGGELLERYRVSRGRPGVAQALELPVDFAGRPLLLDRD